ncbi:hypothetical protein BKH42_04930 [Helicobacter sp. 13S00482-2]|uniref:SDR family oxidoreductase n=1 Tax=Helicobacter sp. 13S00482-2 TaxID=1476200 RepID=UPI000BA64925|nr:SDR family oxidoreductase [Helicobacter sp. 13S00482-2]PAF53667.1 hypothetical protein BKH42_04930 [Helicobacter sp. 13S00482-2]
MKPAILITGGSSGIGQEIALELGEKYNLIFIVRDELKTKKMIATLHHQNEHKIFECDLLDLEKLQNIMEQISKNFKIEAFIHSAGVSYVSYAKNFDFNEMIKCAKINLYSAMLIIKFLLKKNLKPYLKDIIFISSTFSKKGEIGNSFYASTKGGLDAYMKSLSLELAPDIKVNSILPGGIFDTGMTKNLFSQAQKQEILKAYPLGEGKTKDIAQGVKFILHCKWISGQQIIIDGGYSV